MSLTTTKKISLDFYNNNLITINAKQLDTESRFINIVCTDHGQRTTLTPNSMSAFVRYKKADGCNAFRQIDILDDGTLLLELTQQMLAISGKQVADIFITSSIPAEEITDLDAIFTTEDVTILSTMKFYINVIASPIEHSEIESKDECDALLTVLQRIRATETDIAEALNNCEIATTNANNAADRADASKEAADAVVELIEQLMGESTDDSSKDTLYGVKKAAEEAAEAATQAAQSANEAAEATTNIANAVSELMGEETDTSDKNTVYGVLALADETLQDCEDFIQENTEIINNSVQRTGDTMSGDLSAPNLTAENSVRIGQALFSYNFTAGAVTIAFDGNTTT